LQNSIRHVTNSIRHVANSIRHVTNSIRHVTNSIRHVANVATDAQLRFRRANGYSRAQYEGNKTGNVRIT